MDAFVKAVTLRGCVSRRTLIHLMSVPCTLAEHRHGVQSWGQSNEADRMHSACEVLFAGSRRESKAQEEQGSWEE